MSIIEYKAFAKTASQLEMEFGLQITNHQTRKGRSENLADDMEQHSGIESLINWMKRHCLTPIHSANNWTEVHQILAQHGLILREQANGLIFCNDKGLRIKASSVSRSFSKKNLESKLGTFQSAPSKNKIASQIIYSYEPLNKKVIGSELYASYLYEKQHNKTIISKKLKVLRLAKTTLIEKAKKRGRMKRAALKLLNVSKIEKKYLYQQISKILMNDLKQIRDNYSKEHHHLTEGHQSKIWADWLKQKAQEGNQDALIALRYRNRKNQSLYTLSGKVSNNSSPDMKQADSIPKEGTEIYKLDKTVIRTDSKEIKISKGASIPALKKAIEMAKQRYGSSISVKGSPLFKKIIIQIVIQNNIPITFADPYMEIQRIQQEKQHEQSRRYGLHDGGSTSRPNELVRATTRSRKNQRSTPTRTKPNAFSFKPDPPAESQNSLRNLSQCTMVQFTGRSKVLLQDNAHDKLEHQRLQPDNHVRWKVFGLSKNKV